MPLHLHAAASILNYIEHTPTTSKNAATATITTKTRKRGGNAAATLRTPGEKAKKKWWKQDDHGDRLDEEGRPLQPHRSNRQQS